MNEMIYLALDFSTWTEAKDFIDQNDFHGVPVKVGMSLFYREGPHLIEALNERGHPVFLDLKLFDIPTTIMKTMKNIASLNVDMVTIHALGGRDMIRQAKEGLMAGSPTGDRTKLIAVTVLTSMDDAVMNDELNMKGCVQDNVLKLANMAMQSGADGVVCSVHEAANIKRLYGSSFLTTTPGIRLQHTREDDQRRVATPAFARRNGADMLVIGRTVTNAKDPKSAYACVKKEWNHGIAL